MLWEGWFEKLGRHFDPAYDPGSLYSATGVAAGLAASAAASMGGPKGAGLAGSTSTASFVAPLAPRAKFERLRTLGRGLVQAALLKGPAKLSALAPPPYQWR